MRGVHGIVTVRNETERCPQRSIVRRQAGFRIVEQVVNGGVNTEPAAFRRGNPGMQIVSAQDEIIHDENGRIGAGT